ncbi:hypothetical protein THAOC_14268 [Thalassiosira oceanica]|uniref:Glyoxalase/fosfomycin resistance/dioxygenase domain-containing protein n=1 Tax=Thalassiosira oceanica TaxID=159749 RepID=K0SHT6_THAOC|nr:hypothetical protein THAOC_14268 [Thalassiosira oceanica]|eukprot:EJK64940.1 hypothetical protein THAOC_14268 [Thalassiosira oceanica]
MASISFRRALLMVRGSNGVASSVAFYQNGLGLTVLRHTDDWAELACPAGPLSPAHTPSISDGAHQQFHLSIQSVESESQLCTGYSPVLNFDVVDMDETIARCVQMGANLDGPIQYPAHGKVAALRAPGGQMIGLYEPAV